MASGPQAAAESVQRAGAGSAETPAAADSQHRSREVRFEFSRNLPAVLSQLGASLLLSTYQAGKLVALGVNQGSLALSFHNFERAMGVAADPRRIAVVSRAQVWFLRSAPDLAAKIEPVGQHDACFLTRSAHYTGEFQGHEIAWVGQKRKGHMAGSRISACPRSLCSRLATRPCRRRRRRCRTPGRRRTAPREGRCA